MNYQSEERAQKRLLEVALAEATEFATPKDVTDDVIRRLNESAEDYAKPRRTQWLAAALVVFGLGTTIWIAAWPPESELTPPEIKAAQDPSKIRLPPPLVVTDTSNLPKDVRNLILQLSGANLPDLMPMTELANLERLEIRGHQVDLAAGLMRLNSSYKIDPDYLNPLVECPRLHTLMLSSFGWAEIHITALAGVLTLESLHLECRAFALTTEVARSLSKLPLMKRLELSHVELEPDGMKALAKNKRIQSLSLLYPRGLNKAILASIASMRHLQALALPGLDNPVLNLLDPQTAGRLTPEFLAQLPDLVELDISQNYLRAKQIRSLPRSLRKLSIGHCLLKKHDLDTALIALPLLEDLTVSFSTREPKKADDLLVRILRSKQLKHLHLVERPTPAVIKALERQASLRSLHVTYHTPPGVDPDPLELEFITTLPQLELLELRVDSRTARVALPGTDLDPLTLAKRLKVLILFNWPNNLVNHVRTQVGKNVKVWR